MTDDNHNHPTGTTMNLQLRSLLTLALLGMSTLASSQENMSNGDENFLRGFFDHQWLAVNYDQLALKKGSKESVRQFAQNELDMYRSLGNQMAVIDKRFGLVDIPNGSAPAPKLAEGVTRGVTALPAGSSWAGVTILGTLAGQGKLDNNTNVLVNDTAVLESLSGDQFDKAYTLRIIMLHQRMIRHTLREMQLTGGNPEVVAYAKSALGVLSQQTETAENLYNGRPNPPAGPPPAQ